MKGALVKQSGQGPTASTKKVTAKKHPTLTGTSAQTGNRKVQTPVEKDPQTELENLDFLRSKLEQSADEFIKARKELEEILSQSAEGSSEQLFVTESSSAKLKTELQRHRELTAKVESSLEESHQSYKPHRRGKDSADKCDKRV
ncbi:unnamed protein product [Tetraodon nigroviridis]|uniref:(spotted green pufferfish) hypothetical protein n=1 Tax=Tetraodon nigroviridis TaxID=99883 RepID=Q4RJ46_TETNG|nr:unnamed protein product [Tetraodon nigroviridis]